MKNIILLNDRSLNFYNFNELKNRYKIRLTAVVFKSSFDKLSTEIKKTLDNIYVLENIKSVYDSPFPLEALETILKKELKLYSNTWLAGVDELNNLNAAILRQKYNLKGIPYSVILNYRNKYTQKKILSEKGIKVPKFIFLNQENISNNIYQFYWNLISVLGSPFVIKPIDMFGSIAVRKIMSLESFQDYFKKFSSLSSFIAEEFINGQLYHCDFIIQEDNYIFTEVSEYLYNGLSFINGYNHGSIILLKNNPLRKTIINFCKKVNTILGLKTGCGHFEVFLKKEGEIVFLEAAARPAGSLVPVVFNNMFKTNYMNNSLLVTIKEKVQSFMKPQEYYFWIFFPYKMGLIKDLKKPCLQSSCTIDWFVEKGEILNSPASLKDKAGSIIVKNKNYNDLLLDFNYFKNFQAIEIAFTKGSLK